MLPRLIFFLLLLTTFSACNTDEEKINVRLTMEERTGLDARILGHMDTLRPALEAYCADTQADRVAIATDSIIQRRLEEEARMRARLPQNLRDDR
ncbi:hypothetical protein [Neolewinella antarctica]|uniref:Uncharacterized protein n=1 Tax=Neolewinella antarctica TaxID=442734 RepID=A0ABX0XEL7_9BACT|nr:hypothetical protein [Neolewinella antarctica]NJC27760.1 hypothetical protein [Neolewinella antarctica]